MARDEFGISGFDFKDVFCYQSQKDKAQFFYVPGAPVPERNPAGNPSVSLIVSRQAAILQLGSRWEVSESTLEDLRAHIEKDFPANKTPIRLSFAPVEVENAVLQIGNGALKFDEVQTVQTSGFPPYSAIFNVTLSAEDKEIPKAALRGNQNLLRVIYHGQIAVEASAETIIEGDTHRAQRLHDELFGAGESLTPESCQTLVEKLIETRVLIINLIRSANASDALQQKTLTNAKEKAARLLYELLTNTPAPQEQTAYATKQSRLYASAALTENINQPFERVADVSSWFPGGDGRKYIQEVEASIAEPG